MMQFGPRLDQSSLLLWKCAGDQVYRLDRKHRGLVLIIRMKVSNVVGYSGFGKHADYNTEETAQSGTKPS